MFYTVYKITNLVNNKIYIGVHKTSDLEDDYMGSGLLIRKSIEKYGLENFKKEYISIFDNAEDMFNMESELVNEEFIKREDTYNLKNGGNGGWFTSIEKLKLGRINANKNGALIQAKKALEKLFENPIWVKNKSEKFLKTMNEKYGDNAFKTFEGKNHTEETKKRIGEANSKHQTGEGNSQFGTMWIHNIELKENKKIKKEEFSTWEQDGWLKGRKMKF